MYNLTKQIWGLVLFPLWKEDEPWTNKQAESGALQEIEHKYVMEKW